MSVLLDTGFVLALAYSDDTRSLRAAEMYREVAGGRHGAAFVTDYIIDEALTLIWVRTHRSSVVRHLAGLLLDPEPANRPGRLICVGERDFQEAARLHGRMHDRLSFTDCSTLAVMAERGITELATFDRGFDGLCEVFR